MPWNGDKYNAVVSEWALCAAGRLSIASCSWTVHSFCRSVHETIETLITSRLFSTMTVEGRRIHISLWVFFRIPFACTVTSISVSVLLLEYANKQV